MLDAGINQALEQEESNSKVWLKRIAIILVVIVVLVGIGYGLKGLLKGSEVKKQGPTKIQLKDLPPPPPPPPPKEQPKEQPKDQPKEAPKEPEPKPVDAPPPTDTIKMDGPAGDGPSQFGAGAVANENKSGQTGPTIGKPNGSQFNWYAAKIKSQIEDALEKDKELSVGQYKVVVSVWLRKDGSVERFELDKSSGVAETDGLIKAALEKMPAMREAPPADMPMPVKLRVTARSMG
ncbi:MAG TPA: TonB C-terminal domain-containing protein [Methylophilaceae bacterium]|jgi:outer membrane biosynthesis protein TonB